MLKTQTFDRLDKYELNDILDQQILISQMAEGISFTDTDNMDEYERRYIIEKLIQMKKEEYEAKKRALAEAKANHPK